MKNTKTYNTSLAAKNARKERLDAMLKPVADGYKKISNATKSGMQKIRNFIRPFVRFANSYGRMLRRLATFVIAFSLLAWLRANNPAVFENIPAIDGLIDSAEIFVEWISKFLTWHFELLKHIIDSALAEMH